ncbi:MAG: hypothetical protein QOE90_2728 [Thermoplasmata archaeon]|jgi:hypothetical protein|nr:hypothetical protein [Thermoplasmata archaeon]
MPIPVPVPREPPRYTLTQSATIHLLGAALGCAVALLLAVLRLWIAAAVVLALSAGYSILRLRTRTVVTATDRRIRIAGTFGEVAIRHEDVGAIRLERDILGPNLVIARRDGSEVRVRDVADPAGAVAVLGSLVRSALAPRPTAPWGAAPALSPEDLVALAAPPPPANARQEPLPVFLPPESAAERAALSAKLAQKRAVRPVDLSFLDRDR